MPPGGRAQSPIAAPYSTALVSSAAPAAEIPGLAEEKSKVRAEEASVCWLRKEVAAVEARLSQERKKGVALKLELAQANGRSEEMDRSLARAEAMRNPALSA